MIKIKPDDIGRKAVKGVNYIVNYTVLTIILSLLAFAGYALWDSKQIYQAADKSHYAVYKPTIEDEGKSFKELQAINAEIIAWLSVYGTNIDYPVTQGEDNIKYVNSNAEGLYSLSGAIFLDSSNDRHFRDFNNILYGHHMEKKTMFGEIGEFADKDMFESHRYGNLYFDGKDHGLEFFAFVHTDAYDRTVFRANVKGEERQALLDYLLAKAIYKRDIEVTPEDNIILLSTCSSSSTNGRDILIAKLSGGTYGDPFVEIKTEDSGRKEKTTYTEIKGDYLLEIPNALLASILFVLLAEYIIYKRKQSKSKPERGRNI